MQNENKSRISLKSPLLKGGGVAEQREDLQNCAQGDDGGFNAHSRSLRYNPNLKLSARELRSNATKQENHLWYDFLSKFSPRFSRQRVINNYILDFYCPKAALAIELDGLQHYEKEAIEYDKARTEYLNGLGIEVIRFTNKEIDKNFSEVCEKIKMVIDKRLMKTPVTRSSVIL